jgi:hypothetical protein
MAIRMTMKTSAVLAAVIAGLVALTLAFGASTASAAAAKGKPGKAMRSHIVKTIAAQDGDGKATDVDIPFGPRLRFADLNGDGKTDVILVDWQKDGKWDGGLIDRNRDGTFDFKWTDKNGDGKPQQGEMKPINRTPGPNECAVVPPVIPIGCHWPAGTVVEISGPVQVQDPNVFPYQSYALDLDGDGKADVQVIGTKGGAKVVGTGSPVVVEDPNIFPYQSYAEDLDGDGKADVQVIGTKGGAKVVGTGSPVVVEDPNIFPYQSYAEDLDGDGKADVQVIGTRSEASEQVPPAGHQPRHP